MTFNVAFYGAGRRAQPYLGALAGRPDVAVTAVCDLDQRAAEQTAAGWGAAVFLSYEAMLEEARPAALWVCVEPALQGDVLLKAAERGIPFFVEPPGAVDYERAQTYGRLVRGAGLVTAVGFIDRYRDIVQEAREYLGANPIPLALGWWLCPPDDGVDTVTAERLLWTDACRLVDALRFFGGAVRQVRALVPATGPAGGGLVVQLEFVSGGVGILTCATFARPEPRVELELMGEGWSLTFGSDLTTLRLAERDKTTILRSLNRPAADHAAAFLAAVMARDPAAVAASYPDVLQTLAICHGAGVSVREDRPVAVAEGEGAGTTAARSAGEPEVSTTGGVSGR
jgi:predicted dehydrogenase